MKTLTGCSLLNIRRHRITALTIVASIFMAIVVVLAPGIAHAAGSPVYTTSSHSTKGYSISNGNTAVYADQNFKNKIGAIYPSDLVTIHNITKKWVQVTYPAGKTLKTGYVPTSSMFVDTTGMQYTSKGRFATYRRPNGASCGYVASGDKVLVLGSSGSYVQIRYTVSNGYKFAWARSADVNKYVSAKRRLSVKAHSANIGWQSAVGEGATAGTTGRANALEALILGLADTASSDSAISIRAHVKNSGWQGWVSSGKIAGTTGKNLPIEAVQIRLSAQTAKTYDVYYRLHVRDYGWLGWAKNGETAGSTGRNIPAEAIQIKIVDKGASFARGGSATVSQSKAASQPSSKLQSIANSWKNKYWTTTGKPANSYGSTSKNYYGIQCKGFASWVFKETTGITYIGSTKSKPNNWQLNYSSKNTKCVASTSRATVAHTKSVFAKAAPGDFVQMRRNHGGSHSAIVMNVSTNKVTVLECNADGHCKVQVNSYTWQQWSNKNSAFSIYRKK